MKRMVLVPEDALNRYEQRQRLETSPIMSNIIHKNTQMSNILQREGMSDDQKQKLFNAELERYLELRQQKDSLIPNVRVIDNEKGQQQAQPGTQLSDAVVVEPVPKTMRPRATALLNWLKTRPEVVTWDKTGQVKIEGETIPDSNISDLVSDAMRSRKNFNPIGSKEFFQALSKLNVPNDLVRNQERWKQLMGETSSARATPQSPPRSSPRFHSILRSYEERDTPKRWLDY